MKKEYRQSLFLLIALTVPFGLGGVLVDTSYSLWMGTILFFLAGWIMPFFYYMIQKRRTKIEYGGYRGAAHLVIWPVSSVFAAALLWYFLDVFQRLNSDNKILFILSAFLIMTALIVISFAAAYYSAKCYFRLKDKEFLRRWLAVCFFTGLIPASVMISFFSLYFLQSIELAPYYVLFFVTNMIEKAFLLKIGLAMITFSLYLYFSLNGTKGKRMTEVIFTAIFYLMIIYIPIVFSLYIPGNAAWRAYADPAYLSIFPVLSDLWSVFLALWLGNKTAQWIFT